MLSHTWPNRLLLLPSPPHQKQLIHCSAPQYRTCPFAGEDAQTSQSCGTLVTRSPSELAPTEKHLQPHHARSSGVHCLTWNGVQGGSLSLDLPKRVLLQKQQRDQIQPMTKKKKKHRVTPLTGWKVWMLCSMFRCKNQTKTSANTLVGNIVSYVGLWEWLTLWRNNEKILNVLPNSGNHLERIS